MSNRKTYLLVFRGASINLVEIRNKLDALADDEEEDDDDQDPRHARLSPECFFTPRLCLRGFSCPENEIKNFCIILIKTL